MSQFTNGFWRGMGYIAAKKVTSGGFTPKRVTSYTSRSTKKSEFEKAIEFPISGRAETLFGKSYNLFCVLEDEMKNIQDWRIDSAINQVKRTADKFHDVLRFIDVTEKNSEYITHLTEYMNAVNDVLPKLEKELINYNDRLEKEKEEARQEAIRQDKRRARKIYLTFGIFLLLIGSLFYFNPPSSSEPTKTEEATQVEQVDNTSEPVTTGYVEPKQETYNGHTVYTGKRGGRYYYGKSGRKVYIN